MPRKPIQMTDDELMGLPPVMGLEQAAKAWGLGRTIAYELARSDDPERQLPFQVKLLGTRYRVTKADLFHSLGRELPELEHRAAS